MILLSLIAIVVALLGVYFLFLKKKTGSNTPIEISAKRKENSDDKKFVGSSGYRVHTKSSMLFFDDDGRPYYRIEKRREVPRKTYIKANLSGKYWGEIDPDLSNRFQQSDYYSFNIYEVILKDTVYNTETPFVLEEDQRIPRERLPKLLQTVLEQDGKVYEVHLHEPVFSRIDFNRKLHQEEGNQVFGTIEAIVTGYILDFVTEVTFEKEYHKEEDEVIEAEVIQEEEKAPEKTTISTGNIERNGDYTRTEYFYSDYKDTYWGKWDYKKSVGTRANEGFFSTVFGFVTGIIGIGFLLLVLPQLGLLFPFFLIVGLLHLIPSRIFTWGFRIVGIFFLFMFIVSLTQTCKGTSGTTSIPKPKPVVTNSAEEAKPENIKVTDTANGKKIKDTLITHYRIWKDYDGTTYEGKIWTRSSDYLRSKKYKQTIAATGNTPQDYDYLIHLLKEKDKNQLKGVYQLFDSIQAQKQLSSIKFAELVVSFVQDIPYTIILQEGCDPELYNDRFIRQYLSEPNARCDGFERFGINSPVEFMSNLNGDCDTRTLLLYTMLAHYGYDVVLLSSEYYNHSILGINLPIDGLAYPYQNQRYVLWETTAPDTRPGVLPKSISNLNYWRISLKSK